MFTYEHLALLTGIRKQVASSGSSEAELDEIICRLCFNTGLINFVKQLSELAVDQGLESMLDQEHKRIWYYMRLELLWIISNIVASIDFQEHGQIIYSLFYNEQQDIT